KTISAENSLDSLSFSRRYFTWKKKVAEEVSDDEMEGKLSFSVSVSSSRSEDEKHKTESFKIFPPISTTVVPTKAPRRKLSVMAVSKLRSAISMARAKTHFSSGLGSKVVGTLFGHRRGHVHFAFQEDFKQRPAFLVELATPTSNLVKEMASGLVRIALECEKKTEKKGGSLLEEPIWRTYCNGKKCGYGIRRECSATEWKILSAIGPITMGAGVLPPTTADDGGGSDGEMMYMRAKFERVVGSNDSEAYYMMNPDGNGGPELSIYLLRV
ncbi:hypothetical protein M569_10812, partial [Genlisea aurea]